MIATRKRGALRLGDIEVFVRYDLAWIFDTPHYGVYVRTVMDELIEAVVHWGYRVVGVGVRRYDR